jgi:hypothetical protein
LDSSELGKTLDFDPPALIVGQMQLKHIHLVLNHLIDVPLDEFLGKKVAADVE